MRKALLDVSFLLATFDANHVSHSAARTWLEANIAHGWSSCAITENGFVRIVSQPRYPNRLSPEAAIAKLAEARSSQHHTFRACDLSVADSARIDRQRILGPNVVTDAYLLALAVRHDDRLVTLDQRISTTSVAGATNEHLVVV